MITRHRIYRYATIESTNDEAKRLALLGEPHGTVVAADEQTAGRGRAGRAWITPPRSAVAMTLILRPDIPAHHIPGVALLGGLAVAEGIEQVCGLRAQIKWPNDVLIADKKTAGVLAEATFNGDRLDSVVLGIGVNVNAGPPPDLPLDYPATCLAAEVGRMLDRDRVAEAILSAFDDLYLQIGTPAVTAALTARLAMRGKMIRVTGWNETCTGILEGVTDEGAIVVRLDSGEGKTILAGDVHLRVL